jgi:hypothetical protein
MKEESSFLKKRSKVIAHSWLMLEDADLQSLSGQVPYR